MLYKSRYMIGNYLLVALRNLKKRSLHALINIFGLAVGLSAALLIFLFVRNEFSYDTFFSDADRIYKLVEQERNPAKEEWHAAVPYAFARILVRDYPEVIEATAISGPYNSQLVNVKKQEGEEKSFLQHGVLLADSSFFSVFDFEMLHGDPKTALTSPNSVVLTESTARRYFGDENPVGKSISNGGNGRPSVVTGVCADPPEHSHLAFQSLVSSNSVAWFSQDSFNLARAFCYVKLHSETDPGQLEARLPELIEKYLAGAIEKAQQVSWQDYQAAGNGHQYFLRALTDIHLDPADFGGMKPSGNKLVVRMLIVMGILILVIAAINFTNLSTTQSAERTQEISMRKVLGALPRQLTRQFLTESLLLVCMAAAVAMLITSLSLPSFNRLTGKELSLAFDSPLFWIILTVWIIITLIAGTYPAHHLGSLKLDALFRRFSVNPLKRRWMQNGLIGFQFWISIGLIICTLVIYDQIRYLSEKNLGFDQEKIIVMEGAFHRDATFIHPFMREIERLPQVERVAGSLWVHGFQDTWSDQYRKKTDPQIYPMDRVIIGDQFAETAGFELIAGNFFSENSQDSSQILLNESAVKMLGLNDPVGQRLVKVDKAQPDDPEIEFVIKGVVKDFNFRSLHQSVRPLVIQSNENNYGRIKYLLIKLDGTDLSETLNTLERKWEALVPGRPFNYRFLDETLAARYEAERRTHIIFTLFSGLSIFLTCMGLFAVVSYTLNHRKKEIAIRRIVGARWRHMLLLFSRDYVKIILLSFMLVAPIAWWLMYQWLQEFAYGIDLQVWHFILSGLIPILITGSIIGFGTLRAVRQNPTRNL